MRLATLRPSIRPARRLAFRIAAAIMLIQAAIFATAGLVYLVWFESNLAAAAEAALLAPGRLIQSNQLSYAAISDRATMQELVGPNLLDAMLVGANGNIFHALDSALLGRRAGTIEGIEAEWFSGTHREPMVARIEAAGHAYLIGITPLITYENVAPFLYTYVKLDASPIDHEREQMRVATIVAVLFAILATTVVIYGAFEWLLFRRIRRAVKTLEGEHAHALSDEREAARDEMGLVEIGLRKIAAERARERSMRAMAESALIEVQAKESASAIAAQQAETEARRARALIEAVPDGLITIDRAAKVLTCNEAAARCLGAPPAEIVGRPLRIFLRPSIDACGAPPRAAAQDADWPRIGTHRAVAGAEEIEIVVSDTDSPGHHRAVFLRLALDYEVRHELERLSDSLGHALRLTPGQLQSVGERLAMLRDYVASLEAERRIVSGALDALPLAVVIVDASATIRFSNKLAERLLSKKDGLLVLQGRLSAARSAENAQLRRRIESVIAESDPAMPPWTAMRVERPDGMALFIRIAPLGSPAGVAIGGALAIVLVSDAHMAGRPSTPMLRQLHGLTHAEAEILGRLTQGARLQEIAEELGISIETVRTHLKAIFAKTGTSRQADLVRHAILSGAMLADPHQEGARASSPAAALPAAATPGDPPGPRTPPRMRT